jgi:hypothetical protein
VLFHSIAKLITVSLLYYRFKHFFVSPPLNTAPGYPILSQEILLNRNMYLPYRVLYTLFFRDKTLQRESFFTMLSDYCNRKVLFCAKFFVCTICTILCTSCCLGQVPLGVVTYGTYVTDVYDGNCTNKRDNFLVIRLAQAGMTDIELGGGGVQEDSETRQTRIRDSSFTV